MFKPMLAGKAPSNLAKLTFPVMASAKLDGIRCIVVSTDWFTANVEATEKTQPYLDRASTAIAITRTLKPVPNIHIQAMLDDANLIGLDGELIVGNPTNEDCYRASMGVTSIHGKPDFTFYAFDNAFAAGGFQARLAAVADMDLPECVQIVEHVTIENAADLEAFEASTVAAGYEGVMVRSLDGDYKHGRSTTRQGILLKVKRFSDDEARITGTEELVRKDGELGGVLGALIAITADGIEFKIGTGFDAAERTQLWKMRDSLAGRFAKFAHFESSGAPRFPTFLGFRASEDMPS